MVVKGISIKPTIGLGDGLQFSSVPENYYRATGDRLYDVNRPWFFDFNPYVTRSTGVTPSTTIEMWNFSPTQYQWPKLREHGVYLSNAEIHASVWKVPVVLNRPRLYRYEDYPFEKRELILLHADGRSHGKMPPHVIDHVVKKYGPTGRLRIIGKDIQIDGVPKIVTPTFWDLAETISKASMLIGVDSGPSWIAACYPDVVVKILRTKPTPEHFKTHVPLEVSNVHSHWDDRCRHVFNPTEDDLGFTYSYRRI